MNNIEDVIQKVVDMAGVELVSSMDNHNVRVVYLVSTPKGTEVCFYVKNQTDDYVDLLVKGNTKKFKTFIFNLKYELAIFEGFEPKRKHRAKKIFVEEESFMPMMSTKLDELVVQPKNLEGAKRDLRKDINQVARIPKNLYSGQIMILLTKIEDANSTDDLKLIKQELDGTVKANIAAYKPVAITKPVVSSATKSMAQKIQERRAQMAYM